MSLITHFDFARFGNASPAFEPVDFVLFEQKLDAFCIALDHLVFVGEHLCPIDRWRFAFEPHFSEVMFSFMKLVRGVQERLGGDTTYVQAGAAERVAPFNAGCF